MTKHTHYPMLGEKKARDRRLPCEIRNMIPKAYQKIMADPTLRDNQTTLEGKKITVPDYDGSFYIHSETDSHEELNKNMADMKKATPKHERAGVLSVTIWENKGEKGNYNTFSIQRGYTKEGKWENTESMRANDLLPLAELLRSTYAKHVAVKEKDGE